MATRKKKSKRTRAKSLERSAKKKTVPKKVAAKATPRTTKKKLAAKATPRTVKRATVKKTTVKKKASRQKTPSIVAVPAKRRRNEKGQFLPSKPKAKRRKAPKASKPAKRRKRPVEPIKQPKTQFHKLRRKQRRKVPVATRPKRRGSLEMRGAEGQERSRSVGVFWEKVNQGFLFENIMRTYESLLRAQYRTRPSLYTRFTFLTSDVETIMSGGSPKILGKKHGNLNAWFFAGGLAYTIEGAETQLRKAFADIEASIDDAQDENPNAEFFLEFVTVRAYVVN